MLEQADCATCQNGGLEFEWRIEASGSSAVDWDSDAVRGVDRNFTVGADMFSHLETEEHFTVYVTGAIRLHIEQLYYTFD